MSGQIDKLITAAFGIGVLLFVIKNATQLNTLTSGTVGSTTDLIKGIANA
jgi:hypothetical protein